MIFSVSVGFICHRFIILFTKKQIFKNLQVQNCHRWVECNECSLRSSSPRDHAHLQPSYPSKNFQLLKFHLSFALDHQDQKSSNSLLPPMLKSWRNASSISDRKPDAILTTIDETKWPKQKLFLASNQSKCRIDAGAEDP